MMKLLVEMRDKEDKRLHLPSLYLLEISKILYKPLEDSKQKCS